MSTSVWSDDAYNIMKNKQTNQQQIECYKQDRFEYHGRDDGPQLIKPRI